MFLLLVVKNDPPRKDIPRKDIASSKIPIPTNQSHSFGKVSKENRNLNLTQSIDYPPNLGSRLTSNMKLNNQRVAPVNVSVSKSYFR